MNTTDPLRRLADTRPAVADHTGELVTPLARQALFDAIVSEEATTRRQATRPRRRVARSLAVPALAGAVVVGLIWQGATFGPEADRSEPGSSRQAAAGAPVLLDRVRLAMAEADNAILHIRSDFGNGVLWEAWHDSAQRRSRTRSTTPTGTPLYDHEMSNVGTGTTVRVVSHQDQAWWVHTLPPERAEAGPGHGMSAADIRAQLQDGTLEQVGPETLAGREVLRLRWVPASKPGFITVPGDLWVDADTLLPIRSVTRFGKDGEKVMRSDYEWLPRSPAAVADLVAPIPADFVQRASAPEQPVGADGLG